MMKKLLFIGALFLGSVSVSAQTMMDTSTLSLGVRQIQQRVLLRNGIASSTSRRTAGGQRSNPSNSPAGGGTRGTNSGRQTPAGTTTFRLVAPMLVPQQLALRTPKQRAEAEQFFAGLLNSYNGMARQKGAPTNDVSRAASFAISSLYYVHSGGRDLSPGQLDALRQQMREIFSGDAQFQRLSNRQKQELYESYVIQGMFVSSVYDGASQQGDRGKVGEMRSLARQNLEELLGVSADTVSFTGNGIEFR